MKDYYEILGLSKGAEKSEIKKAYFKLVRQYTPESDPERFMEIREAYESLKVENNEDRCQILIPDDPLAGKLLEEIIFCEKCHQYKEAIALCEEALRHFPGTQGFRYLLGRCQLKAANTGKAIKTLEPLVIDEPENRHYQKELANAYLNRGYTKKAFPVFQKAYDMGCKENDFILMFSMVCESNYKQETGRKILFDMVRSEQKKTRDVLAELIDAYVGLFKLNESCSEDQREVIADCVVDFLRSWSAYLDEDAGMVMNLLFEAVCNLSNRHGSNRVSDMVTLLKEAFQSDESKEVLHSGQYMLEAIGIECDDRMGDGVTLMGGCLTGHSGGSKLQKFGELDAKLCVMEEMPGVLGELDILEAEYPLCFQLFSEFILTLRSGKGLKYLKSKLSKEYDRLFKRVSSGGFDMLFKGGLGDLIFGENDASTFPWPDFDHQEPFARNEPKVGRNGPCPCGSGRKYKNCCGK